MKNIHVLPTDKPSNIVISTINGKLKLNNNTNDNVEYHGKNQHIYITSDEEIKEGDNVILKSGRLVKAEMQHGTLGFKTIDGVAFLYFKEGDKRVILTTDQDLIKDGVQAIDDEFLEWFVKNPSCEKIEVKSYYETLQDGLTFDRIDYQIIIPKEEQSYICPKTNQNCDDEMCDSASNCNIDNPLITDSKELSFEEISNQFHQIANDFKHPFEEYEMKSCKTYSDNQEIMPKQETLEEDLAKTDNEKLLYQIAYNRGVLYGIKWQQEQDKELYSEGDLQTAFQLGRTYEHSNYESTNQLEIVQYLDNLKKQKKYE